MKNKHFIDGKRGQLFTLIAIALIGLLFLSVEIYSYVGNRATVDSRISSMEGFLSSIETNLQRQMYISGFRIIFLAENQITLTGDYVDDFDSFFNEAFYNGTVNGIQENITLGATYGDLISSIDSKAEKINVDISLNNTEIFVSQSDPWHVKFTMVSDFVMEDKSGLARWEKRQNISAYIPVNGFEDPLFIVNTNAQISRKINQTIYDGVYTDGVSVSNLLNHVNRGYYSANPSAPSFLKRIKGDLTSDENGIESFVDANDLAAEGFSVQQKSKVDYIYFSLNNPTHYGVTGMPTWFRVDNGGTPGRLEKYNVTGLTY